MDTGLANWLLNSFFLDSWTNMPVILIYSKMYPDWYKYIVAWLENVDL